MVVKLRPGWAYNKAGKAVPAETLEQHEAKRITLKWSHDNGSKPKARNKLVHPFVLDGRVKMTPRRYELLSVALCGLLEWMLDADWSYYTRGAGPLDHIMMPQWAGKRVESTLTTLHKLRLVRWTRGTINVNVTASGLEAMEQYEAYKGVTQQ